MSLRPFFGYVTIINKFKLFARIGAPDFALVFWGIGGVWRIAKKKLK